MFGKKKKQTLAQAEQKVWRCFNCHKTIRFNVDMLCSTCKSMRDGNDQC
jgi:ABC-type ATPase with predicted acetyltransferase domain